MLTYPYPKWLHDAMDDMSMKYHEAFKKQSSDPYFHGATDAISVCLHIIRHHFENRNNGWISVADRLPEFNIDVIGYIKCKDGTCAIDTVCYEYSRKDWITDYIGEVTHWQPLPLPPKE